MDKSLVRHLMAAIVISEELKVPNQRGGDPYMADDRMRKQFSQLVQNTYTVVDLMIELGEAPKQY
ncbi:MAG: hypothetical protein IAF58_17680 [Leptolyngbya sp.]|nr:hypothetical protein [Candidatus Melainabacteria bacterium]